MTINVGSCKERINNAFSEMLSGNIDRSEELASEVLSEVEETVPGEHEQILERIRGRALNQLANIDCVRGNNERALIRYKTVHEIALRNNDSEMLVGALCNIGNIYGAMDEEAMAHEFYQQALTEAQLHNLELYQANILCNLAGDLHWEKDYDLAINYFEQSLTLYRKLEHLHGVALVLANIASVFAQQRDYVKSLPLYHEALEIAESLGDKLRSILILDSLGNIFSDTSYQDVDFAKSETFLKRAIVLADEVESKREKAILHKSFSLLYKRSGDLEKALEHFELHHDLEKQTKTLEAKLLADKIGYERKSAERDKQLALALERENILNNILPEEITQRLIKGENPIADHFDSVSILFMDIVNFTTLSTKISAQQLVHLLNAIFSAADGVMREFGLEKIKTIGDAYMAVAGAPIPQEDHAHRAANAALKLLDVMKNLEATFSGDLGDKNWLESIPEIQVRIGLHCGPVAAGVVGENKFLYDLWGDAVNTAARMESHGEAGRIHVSEDFVNALSLKGSSEVFSDWEKEGMRAIPRGEMEIKGKGIMRTSFLETG